MRNKDGTPEILNASKGEMDAHLDLGFRDEKLAFIGAAHLAGLTIAHPMLAPQPVPRLGFDAWLRRCSIPAAREFAGCATRRAAAWPLR